MIVRSWTGWTADEKAADYAAYMHEVALPGYSAVAGNRGVLMLRREVEGGRTEFTMITLWDSLDAVRAFAGEDPSVAVFYDKDEEFLVDRELTVKHYEVYGATPTLGSPAAAGPA